MDATVVLAQMAVETDPLGARAIARATASAWRSSTGGMAPLDEDLPETVQQDRNTFDVAGRG
jgi:hypothetical protein